MKTCEITANAAAISIVPPARRVGLRARAFAEGRVAHLRSPDGALARNALFVMLTTLVNSGLGAIYWFVAAREFAPSAVGLATAYVSAMTLASLLTCSGLGTVLLQVLPRREDSRWSVTVAAAFAAAALSGLTAGAVCVGALPLLSDHLHALWELRYALTFPISVAAFSAATITDYLFLAERRAELSLLRSGAFGLIKLAAVVGAALVFASGNDWAVFTTWGLGLVLSLGVADHLIRQVLGREHHLSSIGLARELRQVGKSFAGHHLLNSINLLTAYLLPLLVTIRLSAGANAYFYVTWMVGSIFFIISASTSGSLIAEGAARPGRIYSLAWRSLRLVGAVLIPVSAGVVLLGHTVLHLFGTRYAADGYSLLLILLAGAVPDALTNIGIAVLRTQHRFRLAVALNGTIATVTLVSSWFLVRSHGLDGVGVGWCLGQVAGCLYLPLALRSPRGR